MLTNEYNDLITLIAENPDLALIPIALLIGKAVKMSKIKDEFIPIIVLVISSIIGFLIGGADTIAAIKGLVAGFVAVGGTSALKQLDKASSNRKNNSG
jgi:hypothetical protein